MAKKLSQKEWNQYILDYAKRYIEDDEMNVLNYKFDCCLFLGLVELDEYLANPFFQSIVKCRMIDIYMILVLDPQQGLFLYDLDSFYHDFILNAQEIESIEEKYGFFNQED